MLKESNRSYNTCLVLKTNQQTKYLNTGKSVMGFGNWRFFLLLLLLFVYA